MASRQDRNKVHKGRRKKGQKKRRMMWKRRHKMLMKNAFGRNRRRRAKRHGKLSSIWY